MPIEAMSSRIANTLRENDKFKATLKVIAVWASAAKDGCDVESKQWQEFDDIEEAAMRALLSEVDA